MTWCGGFVSKILRSGDVDDSEPAAEPGSDVDGGDDGDDCDVSMLAADDCRLRKRFRKRRCLMLDGEMPRP
jgi:hypothetical protein